MAAPMPYLDAQIMIKRTKTIKMWWFFQITSSLGLLSEWTTDRLKVKT
jgi:hypothetical protein